MHIGYSSKMFSYNSHFGSIRLKNLLKSLCNRLQMSFPENFGMIQKKGEDLVNWESQQVGVLNAHFVIIWSYIHQFSEAFCG